jgi:hypothetical protein
MFWRGIPAVQDVKAPRVSIANMEIFFISIRTLRDSPSKQSILTTKDMSFTMTCPLRLRSPLSSCRVHRRLDRGSGQL